jgi:hypothetical protein
MLVGETGRPRGVGRGVPRAVVRVDDRRGGGKRETMGRNDEAGPDAVDGGERVEPARATLLEHHASLLRWGTSEEIGARIAELHRIMSWWTSKGVPAGEDEAGRALDTALERLTTLRKAMQVVEAALDDGGYEFDGHLRVLRAAKAPPVGEDVPPEKSKTLLAETIVDVFEKMREQGRPAENTSEIRTEIRAHLGRTLHPKLLSDIAIRTALDEALATEAGASVLSAYGHDRTTSLRISGAMDTRRG